MMICMDNLIGFLRARLNEDEWLAKKVLVQLGDDDGFGLEVSEPVQQYIAYWTPSQVLAEVEAKRGIVELHQEAVSNDFPDGEEPAESDILCMACTPVGGPLFYPCRTLRILAHPYADHPDYRAEWRPE